MNPYEDLPEKAFWKTAVSSKSPFDINQLWDPKFSVKPKQKVATFGSCFAQHIGRALKERGYHWFRTELGPENLSNKEKYNYDIFSCRTGNIYTTSLLCQWVNWAFELEEVPDEYWEKDGRIYDPFRPNIEPNGFSSKAEMVASRNVTLRALRDVFENANYLVFTLGLTESWFNRSGGYEYPMCPGTVAGEFDANEHEFREQEYIFIRQKLLKALGTIRKANRSIKVILTVSPVPLTATKSNGHVLTATMHSKSVLRAVAGELSKSAGYIDYFPSYEIINGTPFKAMFFEANQRSVNPHGVGFVMNSFFQCQKEKFTQKKRRQVRKQKSTKRLLKQSDEEKSDIICEEELLSAFSK